MGGPDGSASPFLVPNPFTSQPMKGIGSALVPLAARIAGLRTLDRLYSEWLQTKRDPKEFPREALKFLDIRFDVPKEDLDRIPTSGPIVVIANHPFGMIEGLMLLDLISRVRDDVKVMANSLLGRVSEMKRFLIGVNPYDTESAAKQNMNPLRASIGWLKDGGALLTFPSGDVSRFFWKRRAISDPKWSETVGRIARKANADVLPVFFPGRNSLRFLTLGALHPRLRTALLPRELLNKRGRSFSARVGSPVGRKELAGLESDSARTSYLRVRTYVLRGRADRDPVAKPPKRNMQPVAPAPERRKLVNELDALPEGQVLVNRKDYRVYAVRAHQAPTVMLEIGRVREITFRANYEGTGFPIDVDRYDQDYVQLVLWDVEREAIAGGYRLGPTDEILEKLGIRGFYTRTLFRYSTKLLDQISPALELGRSYVAQEYQRQMAPLMLLWQGIGAYIIRNPRYRYLFGPVSINDEYHTMSKELMLAFLSDDDQRSQLANLVKAKCPPRELHPYRVVQRKFVGDVLSDIDAVSALVSEIEADHKGVPILLKHYLKMGARLLSFNVDAAFGHVLDGLILTDLAKSPERVLRRYMGSEGAQSFLAYHKGDAPAEVPHDTTH